MSELSAQELPGHYRGIRQRLLNPPNLVKPLSPQDIHNLKIIKELRDQVADLTELNSALQLRVAALTPPDEPVEHINCHLTVARIKRVVARHFRITTAEIDCDRRHVSVVRPRQITMYLARTMTTHSMPEIARFVGNRDHTTVLHAVRKITELRLIDVELNEALLTIEGLLAKRPTA